MTFPVPLGVTLISLFTPSSMVIVPEFVPPFVLNIRFPVPLLVIVASALLSPTCTVSACRVTSPVPCGTRSMFLLDVLTISWVTTSRSPPNWGSDH